MATWKTLSTSTPLNESFLLTKLHQPLWSTIANTSPFDGEINKRHKTPRQTKSVDIFDIELFYWNCFESEATENQNSVLKIHQSTARKQQFYWCCIILQKNQFCKLRKTHRGDISNFTKLTNSVNHSGNEFVVQTCKNTRAQLIKVFPLWPNPALLKPLLLLLHALFKNEKCSSTAGMNISKFATLVFTQAQQLWVLI